MSKLDEWRAEAQFILLNGSGVLKVPIDKTLREAIRAALFVRSYWIPTKKRPGLKDATNLSLAVAEELLSLVQAVQEAQFALFVLEEAPPAPPEEAPELRARYVIAELHAAFEHLLGLGLPAEEAHLLEQTRRLRAREENPLELILLAYAEAAQRLAPRLLPLSASVDLAVIEESQALLSSLESALKDRQRAGQRLEEARTLYYRLLVLLQERVALVRTAASFVFRKHKSIVRQVTSAHARAQRAKHRSKKPRNG